jgi:hypothetical protein
VRVRRDGSVEAARNGTQRMSEVEDFEDQWQPHSVFEYLQETFCFESDTFVCSGFDDTSREVKARQAHRAEVAAAAAAANASAAAAAAEAAAAAAAVEAAEPGVASRDEL